MKLAMERYFRAVNYLAAAQIYLHNKGESEPLVRSPVCNTFQLLGIELDEARNEVSPTDSVISKSTSVIRIFIIKCREDWEIARQCHDAFHDDPRR